MSMFGLVHGAYHGAWCWDLLVPKLQKLGHTALTVDLPIEDPQAGASAYAEAAVTAFQSAGDDLVVVGHSLAGLVIPLVAERRPVRQLVYLCALLAEPGRSYDEVQS